MTHFFFPKFNFSHALGLKVQNHLHETLVTSGFPIVVLRSCPNFPKKIFKKIIECSMTKLFKIKILFNHMSKH